MKKAKGTVSKANGAESRPGEEVRSTQYALRIDYLPIGLILPGNNGRKIDEKNPGFIELVTSIKAAGIIVPVMVRNHPQFTGKYELRAGERRIRAANLAGLDTVPAIIFDGLDESAAELITLIENKHREDLLPLEEVKKCEDLLVVYKGDCAAAAAKMGIPVYRAKQLARINENISKKLRKDIEKDGLPEGWTIAHLALLANQPQNIQDELLDRPHEMMRCKKIADLEKFFASMQMLLSSAPWDLKDVGLVPKAGACFSCPKRTGANPGLFDDEVSPERDEPAKTDRCMDKNCWQVKQLAFVDRKKNELQGQYPNLVFAVAPDSASKIQYTDRERYLKEKYGDDLIMEDFKKTKEGEKGAVPALIVYGSGAGEVKWIRKPRTEDGGRRTEKEKGGKSLKQKREELAKKRWSAVVNKMAGIIREAPLIKLVCDDATVTVMALTATFGTTIHHDGKRRDWKSFAKLESLKVKEVTEALWFTVRVTIANMLNYAGPVTQVPDEKIDSAKAAAKLIGEDIDELFKWACEEYKEPKSWKVEKSEMRNSKSETNSNQ